MTYATLAYLASPNLMKLLIDAETFHSLHPFSCVCDEHGRIVSVGRSLATLIPTVQVGSVVWDHLRLLQPHRESLPDSLADLAGELIVVGDSRSNGPVLCGHLVYLPAAPTRYLFALHPTVALSKQLAENGVRFPNFETGDPAFDFIVLIRHLERANEQLATELTALQLDSSLSATLRDVVAAVYSEESESIAYQRCLEVVCDRLGWDLGHLVLQDPHMHQFTLAPIWHTRTPQTLEALRSVRGAPGAAVHDDIPLEARQHAQIAWVAEYSPQPGFTGAAALSMPALYCAVWVPVVVAGQTVAILELFSTAEQRCSPAYLHFFELLRDQLAQAITHIRARDAERQRLAAVAHASKMATLGQITAGIAHEINNPISTIALIAAILKRSATHDTISQELVSTQAVRLESCVQRISTIISELKCFSRDTSKDTSRLESLRTIVSETLDLCRAGFSAKGISLICDEVPADWTVMCRSSQISQALLNLLGNAQDAALEGKERWVRLEVHDIDEWYELSISDSGNGVPLEIRDKITTPFFTTKPPGKGTGLGLSISANIMVDHGGTLYLDQSAPHTRFVLRLPKGG